MSDRRRRSPLRFVFLVLLLIAVAAGVWAGRALWHARSLNWQIDRGRELLANAHSLRDVRTALERWEQETRAGWSGRVDDLVARLCTAYPLDDARVRLLLTHVTGADYGDRAKDWERWFENRRRAADGQNPLVPRGERRIAIKHRWSAPVGLTGWFTTILPLDGQIYVASVGSAFDAHDDPGDGVVRVNGSTGAAALIFAPPDRRGVRDVVGLAAGTDCLFASSLNGFLYCLNADGGLLWQVHVNSPIVTPPLTCDLNNDRVSDAVVATRDGNVVAISGQSRRTVWVARVSQPPPGTELLGTVLALGDLGRNGGPQLVVTTPLGDVEVLSARNGRRTWRSGVSFGTLAGAVCWPASLGPGPPAYVGDRDGHVHVLLNSGATLESAAVANVAAHADETLIAGLRTMRTTPDAPPLLLACPTGDYAGQRGAVCALAPEGVQWRLPVGGAVWGTPAVADLNGDRVPEIIACTIAPGEQPGTAVGVLAIVSAAGHLLHREVLDAPVECSPVVADVDGDGYLEVLVADQAGWLHCFGTGYYGPVQWGLVGGDSHNTRNAANAYAWGQVAVDRQWQWQPE